MPLSLSTGKTAMTQRIIYPHGEGIAVIIPNPESGLTLAQIADKDVPNGRPYKIVPLRTSQPTAACAIPGGPTSPTRPATATGPGLLRGPPMIIIDPTAAAAHALKLVVERIRC